MDSSLTFHGWVQLSHQLPILYISKSFPRVKGVHHPCETERRVNNRLSLGTFLKEVWIKSAIMILLWLPATAPVVWSSG